MINIDNKAPANAIALFELGFRPFFAAAGLFAVIAVAIWMAVYTHGAALVPAQMSAFHWHGHEMVFGYGMAVVAGFLLTAVVNWTGLMTPKGWPLGTLVALWLIARIALLSPFAGAVVVAAIADTLFAIGLLIGVSIPVWRVRQWKHAGILSKLLLLLVANVVFYLGALGHLQQGSVWGLYSGLYLVVALVFVMGRRVIPFFIERGVDEEFSATNRGWIDVASLLLFLSWVLFEVFTQQQQAVAWLSVVLCAIHALRLWDWHTPGIWAKPLLWSLYLGYAFLVFAFALKAASIWWGLFPSLALHAFAYGSIGLITIGMMSRVALGHSGRNVFDPPAALLPIFAALFVGAIVRVLLPIAAPAYYELWIASSQVLWIVGFGAFSMLYLPIVIRPRVDGRPG